MAACNWANEVYFTDLLCSDKRANTALELLVEDLHVDKDKTIFTFMSHSGSEDFLWGLVRLLGSDNTRVAGNSAYIIGTLAESEIGCSRIMALAKSRHADSHQILADLTRMLTFDDAESVMNAAGTMGTLAESQEGRAWMLSEPSVRDMIQHITTLLSSDNLWTASNAALVLARLCICEDGCNAILNHPNAQSVLSCLVQALGVDEAGRGMNAAFAIGRLCDMDTGRQRLLGLQVSEKMISSLSKMLSCDDAGASKNACFALSCLATNLEGHSRLLQNSQSEDVLKTLAQLLSVEDNETGWFAAMTLRTLASQPKGCIRLRENQHVINALKLTELQMDVNPDLKEEVMTTLEILKRLDQPAPPCAGVKGPASVELRWQALTTKSGLAINYHLFQGDRCVYDGPECGFTVQGLQPCRQYVFRVRGYTEGDTGPFSQPVSVTTEEDYPGPPLNLQVLGATISQLKVGWDPPTLTNGLVKGYYVYQGHSMVEQTTEQMAIIMGLQPNTTYEIQVCAATTKGKGEKAVVSGTTAELGAHAPSKPHIQVIGRNELHITWDPPEVPLGRITRYDLSMNGKGVYSGMELSFSALRLTPDTEYTFVVTCLTNEGRFESKPAKKKTAKDEFEPNRPPLYQAPAKKEDEEPKQVSSKKRKSANDCHKVARTQLGSGKGQLTLLDIERPKSASSSCSSQQAGGARGAEPDMDGDVQPSNSQKPRSTSKSSRRDSLRSSSHKEQPTRSVTSPIASKDASRSQRVKAAFPVTVSYVTIQGGDDTNLELDSCGSDIISKKSPLKPGALIDSAGRNSIRFDRSKTSFLTPKPTSRPRLTRLDTDVGFSAGAGSGNNINSISSASSSSSPYPYPLQLEAGGPTSSLPKPAMPSQTYLEGARTLLSAEYAGPVQRSNNSASYLARGDHSAFLDMTSELLPQHRLRKSSPTPSGISDHHGIITDMYYSEAQQAFIQRAKTFVKSHRPASMRQMQTKVQYTNVPIRLTTGALGSGTGLARVGVGEGLSLQRPPQKGFAPMQLRTQPSNLSPLQLQRVNTTILEPARAIPGRRLESLQRSHTQAAIKTQTSVALGPGAFCKADLALRTPPSMSAGPT